MKSRKKFVVLLMVFISFISFGNIAHEVQSEGSTSNSFIVNTPIRSSYSSVGLNISLTAIESFSSYGELKIVVENTLPYARNYVINIISISQIDNKDLLMITDPLSGSCLESQEGKISLLDIILEGKEIYTTSFFILPQIPADWQKQIEESFYYRCNMQIQQEISLVDVNMPYISPVYRFTMDLYKNIKSLDIEPIIVVNSPDLTEIKIPVEDNLSKDGVFYCSYVHSETLSQTKEGENIKLYKNILNEEALEFSSIEVFYVKSNSIFRKIFSLEKTNVSSQETKNAFPLGLLAGIFGTIVLIGLGVCIQRNW